MARLSQIAAILAASSLCNAFPKLEFRQVPADPTGVTTIKSAQGAEITYKNPGICETTPNVNQYAGYVRLSETANMFFWFFEARTNPSDKPLTLWLNGGPGSDSMIGLFEELGPCNVTEDLQTMLNPYAWNEESNMLFMSQPIGVGFSYETTSTDANGRYSEVDPNTTNTTHAAAVGAWHVLQAFLDLSPQLDPNIKDYTFNLYTESYGGHYGPAFYDYFYQQNQAIASGSVPGVQLKMDTLGIINGIINEEIQAPYYPDFAMNNTYGIKAYDDDTYTQAMNAYSQSGGCRDQIEQCNNADRSSAEGQSICSKATDYCRGNVEGPYYQSSGRGTYDIRHPSNDPTPPGQFQQYLNLASTQQALGVNINYTSDSSSSVFQGFSGTGDFVYPDLLQNLEQILGYGVRVALLYGDADYICNWFGGEAISLAVNFTHADNFRAAGYAPFVVDGVEYGETREYGNFSFTRMYESGHEVPYYQPKASLEFFRRMLNHIVISDGSQPVTSDYSTNGTAKATHTEPYVPVASATAAPNSRSRVMRHMI